MNADKYTYRLFWHEPDASYVAVSSEFRGLSGVGRNPEDALKELREAMELAIETFKDEGVALPKPLSESTYSGQFRVRLPRSLHQSLAEQAERESVSLNTLVVSFLSESLRGRISPTAVRRPNSEPVNYVCWGIQSYDPPQFLAINEAPKYVNILRTIWVGSQEEGGSPPEQAGGRLWRYFSSAESGETP